MGFTLLGIGFIGIYSDLTGFYGIYNDIGIGFIGIHNDL